MNPLRILHTADIHFDRENQEQALASLQALYEHGRDNGVDLWAIAGDLFNRAAQNTAAAGFPRLVVVLQAMINLAPVVAVQGTPTHDIPGCYEALQEINAEFSFALLDPRRSYFLGPDGEVGEEVDDPRLLILGCPEPSKEWFLANKEGLGRDEATQAVVDGMRQLLLGLGAIRRQYAALPCLFVYHGAVEGASLANGQLLQLGELAIGRDDLALVGADYYALGHIHLAQQIGILPAYYAGSAYPCNWGETDQKGFNAVEIGNGSTDVVRIPYPHPPRKKIVCDWHSGDEPYYDAADTKGFQIWLVIRKPKDALLDAEYVQAVLPTNGALPGSRVTVEVIPTETVRAGQITAARGLVDKLEIYIENSGDKPATVGALNTLRMKAAFLESEVRAAGQAGEGLHIRIDRLRLRGAIGVWKGLGLDEIELDLGHYDPGLVALVGANGRGKTTLIENMHPYAEMLTRAGKLQDHFRLKDSYRDLHFTDERTGQPYRALIQVDGVNASGRAEYHLFRDGQPLTNGRKEDYEQKMQQLFGSLALFVRSAFVSQKPPKNHPDLTDATKGEKKALFRELAGLDYLQAYSEAAREKGKALDLQIMRDQARKQSLQEQVQAADEKKRQHEDCAQREQEAAATMEKILAESIQALAQREERREVVAANKRLHDQIRAVILRQDGLQQECGKTAAAIDDYQKIVALRSAAEQAVLAYDKAKVEEGKLNEERARIASEREQRLAEHRDRSEAAHAEDKRLSAEAKMLSRKIAEIEAKKAGFVAKIDQIEILLQQKTTCPKCGHKWADREEERKKELEIVQQNVLDLDLALNPLRSELQQIEAAKAAIVFPPEPQLPPIDACDRQLATARRQIQDLHIEQQRAILAKAQDAGARLEEAQRRLAQIEEQQKAAQTEKEDLEAGIDYEAEAAYETADGRVKDLDEQKVAALDVLATVRAQAESLRQQLEELKAKTEELKTVQRALVAAELDRADWQYLERACGPDGIQALELDALGPSIADTANKLLSAAYGSRFQISFRTTRIGGTGSHKKMIEDFEIWISDSEDGSEQLLETLSGGESVWIKNALYSAFAIIRDRSTGQRFLTVFLDEADGQLDPEARLKYFQMIEAAHAESSRRHTIIVTHSEAAQEMISQHIAMDELAETHDAK